MLKIMEIDRFKLLFEHCFPLKKIISIMTIYTEALFSVADGGKTYNILDPVKDVFRGLFYSVGSIDSYANKNPFLAARNIGLIKGLGRRVYSGGRSRVVYSDADSAFEYDVHTDLEEG